MATTNYHQRGPTELHPFADVPGHNVRSSYDHRHLGQKGVPANASANQPPSCRGRYDLGLAKAGFQNSLHCYAASLSMQPRPGHPGSRPPTSRSLKESNFKLPGRSPITSAPHQQRLSCMKLTFPGLNIGLKRCVFSRLTSGTVSMSRTRGEWS